MNLDFPLPFRTAAAYASTDETHWDLGRSSYLRIKLHCESRFHPVEIFTETTHPEAKERLIWEALLDRIRTNKITLVIVPTLFHIAGSNIAKLSDFSALLELHHVKLLSLNDRIDSDKMTRSQIIFHFVTNTLSFTPTKGI